MGFRNGVVGSGVEDVEGILRLAVLALKGLCPQGFVHLPDRGLEFRA